MKQSSSRLPVIPPEEGEAVWREAAQDVQQERLVAFFKKYGKTLSTLAVLLVLSVAGYNGYQNWRLQQAGAAAAEFAAAVRLVEAGTPDAVAALSALSTTQASGYGALSRLMLAKQETDKAKRAAALAAFAADAQNDALLRSAAAAAAGYSFVGLETALPETLAAQLQGEITARSAFAPLAQEITALDSLRRGDTAAALAQLNVLAEDAATPPALKQRATAYLTVLNNKP